MLAYFFAVGLYLNPHEIPSPLLNKQAPAFVLPTLTNANATFSSENLRGRPWILNVWASWCAACRDEHALLLELARSNNIMLVGLDYKDSDAQANNMLLHLGNPYNIIVTDKDGLVGIEYGVYGAPETYFIDSNGIIKYKKVGALTHQDLYEKLIPLIRGF